MPKVRDSAAALRRALSALPATLWSDLRAAPAYPATGALSVILLWLAEVFIVGTAVGPAYLVYGLCLAASLGALAGLALQLCFVLLLRMHRLLQVTFWALLAGLGARWLADALGAFSRLGTRYHHLAYLTIALCGAGALFIALTLSGMQPNRQHPAGPLAGSPRLRWPAGALLVLCAAALTYADHSIYVGLYLQAHVAMRLVAAIALGFALLLALPTPTRPRFGVLAWALCLGLFAVPVALLDDTDTSTIQGFITRPWGGMMLRGARGLLDADRDGFSPLLGGGDCDDSNPRIHPSAREIPGNGIDDNCTFGDAKRRTESSERVKIPKTRSPMNVVLITVDTLRWDRVGVNDARYGVRGANTMPNLSRWAAKAVNFRRAYTQGGWTSIAVGSMMRGRYPRRLTWTPFFETNRYRMLEKPFEGKLRKSEQIAKMFPLAWRDPRKPLPWWLERRGMRTSAVVDDGFSLMLSRRLGGNLGFQLYREINGQAGGYFGGTAPKPTEKDRKRPRRRRDDYETTNAALSSLQQLDGGQSFFMWVHYFGPHTPDTEHSGIRKDGDSPEQRYDHELRYVDQQLSRLLKGLESHEWNTAIFVTSDHGESFAGRYRSHGMNLDESIIHVPLFARVPGWQARHVQATVGLIDLMPTILALTETPGPDDLDGIDLAPLATGLSEAPDRVLLSDTWRYRRDGEVFADLVAAYDGERKVVLSRTDHNFSAYDQRSPDSPPLRIEGWAVDRLARAILGYVEDTGGVLDLK